MLGRAFRSLCRQARQWHSAPRPFPRLPLPAVSAAAREAERRAHGGYQLEAAPGEHTIRGFAVQAGREDAKKVIQVKDDQHFNTALKDAQDNGGLATVYYTAAWCGPCRTIAPFVEDLGKQHQNVTFLKVDIDEPQLEKSVNKGGVSAVPTFHFYKNGKLIGQLTGASKQQLQKMVGDYSSGTV